MLDKYIAAGQGYEREGGAMDFTCIGIEDGPPIGGSRTSGNRLESASRVGVRPDMLWGLKT
ncbi:hypothetical protein [Streptomyces celluloflavus]|uniref:hypothetical protein n=1 Tax=Streptomyces celluloflavus TaxID=58344 RepID=UPI0036C2C9C8